MQRSETPLGFQKATCSGAAQVLPAGFRDPYLGSARESSALLKALAIEGSASTPSKSNTAARSAMAACAAASLPDAQHKDPAGLGLGCPGRNPTPAPAPPPRQGHVRWPASALPAVPAPRSPERFPGCVPNASPNALGL